MTDWWTYQDYLAHYGVVGMKWGVRRYQNYDGTLTAAGKARLKDSSSAQILKDSWSPNSGKKYSRKAADLGIRALIKMRGDGFIDTDPDNIDDGTRSWFVYEDQTIGMAEVADLINRGYSSKEVKKAIEYGAEKFLDSVHNNQYETLPQAYGSFYLNEDELYTFADACEEIKNSAKHSATYTQSDELCHYGIAGMKWGIRRYQNEDGTLTEAGKKRRARQYTSELKKLSRANASSVAQGMSLRAARSRKQRTLDRQEYKKQTAGRKKKIQRLTMQLNSMDKRLSELKNEYSDSSKKIEKLLEEVGNNKNFLYSTKPVTYSNRKWIGNEAYFQSVKTTKYKVKTYSDKRAKSYKYNKHTKYDIIPVHTEYYSY